MSGGGPRRRLLVVWVVLALLVVGIAVIEYRERRPTSGPREDDLRMLLPAPLAQLGAIEIADTGRLHRFERAADGAWFYHGVHMGGEGVHAHAADPAVTERVERALAGFGRTRIERDFALAGSDGATYGVAHPALVVLVYRRNESQPSVQYAVGHVAPDTVSRYVLVVGRPVVVTIPNYQIENLLALIRDVGDPSPATARTR